MLCFRSKYVWPHCGSRDLLIVQSGYVWPWSCGYLSLTKVTFLSMLSTRELESLSERPRWLSYNKEWKNSNLTVRWRKQACLSDVFFIGFVILAVCTDQVLLFDEWICKCCLMMCQQVFVHSLTADWFWNLYFDILEIPDKICAGEKVSETCHVTVLDAKYFFPNNCGLTFCVWIYKIVSAH